MLTEWKLSRNFESVSTITFYQGDAAAATRHLQARLADVVAANPWLAGALVNTKGGAVGIAVPKPTALAAASRKLFHQASDDEMFPEMGYEALAKRVRRLKVCVKPGRLVVGKPECPLFLITVVRLCRQLQTQAGQHGIQFAVVVSLSHAVGDGCTFYNVYRMLGSTSVVEPLHARVAAFMPQQHREEVFQKSKKDYVSSSSFLLGAMRNILLKPRVKRSAHIVPGTWISSQKRAWSGRAAAVAAAATSNGSNGNGNGGAISQPGQAPTWVSTNDVLTSYFMTRGGYDYGLMAKDLRASMFDCEHAVPGKELPKLAGHYADAIHMFKDEMDTPMHVRRAVTPKPGAGGRLPQFHTARPAAPSTLMDLRGKFAMVTNWSGFYSDMVLPGATQTVHLPLIQLGFLAGRALQGYAVIFRPSSNKIGMYIIERGTTAKEPLAWAVPGSEKLAIVSPVAKPNILNHAVPPRCTRLLSDV